MVIYGSALVGICLIAGNFFGELLGAVLGINCNVGGVGFAMLLLIIISSRFVSDDGMHKKTAAGIKFWQDMYIPVVIGMTATQDVMGALSGGWTALLGGLLVVLLSLTLVPLLSRENKAKGGVQHDS